MSKKVKYEGDSGDLGGNIEENIKGKKFINHPWYIGGSTGRGGLQAHHLITVGSITCLTVNNKKCNSKCNCYWIKRQKTYKYDMNRKNNGVMLPSTVQLACQVQTHVHNSKHSGGLNYSKVKSEYLSHGNQSEIPESVCKDLRVQDLTYLMAIEKLLTRVRMKSDRIPSFYCKKGNDNKFTIDMDKVSKLIVQKLNKFELTITTNGKDYAKWSKIGCANGKTDNNKKKNKTVKNCTSRDVNVGKPHEYRNNEGKLMIPIELEVGK